MRFSPPVDNQTISQALVKGICPFCTYLKNYQSKLVRDLSDPDQVNALCNFHTWALAASSNKSVAAQIFQKLIKASTVPVDNSECSLCRLIRSEEDVQMKAFASELCQSKIVDWLSSYGAFCIPHGHRFLPYVPDSFAAVISDILKRNVAQLQESLEMLPAHDDKGTESGAGILGHAAEFLISQRGL